MMSTTDLQTAGVPGTGDSISVPFIATTPAAMVSTTDFQTPGAGQTTYVSPIANQTTTLAPTTDYETGTGSQANLETGMTSPTDIPTTGAPVADLSTSLSPVPSIQTATVTAPTTAPGIAVTPGTGHSTSVSLTANYPSATVPTTDFHSNTAPQTDLQTTGPETDPPTNIASTTDIGTASATAVDLPTTWVSKTGLPTSSPAGTLGSAMQVTHDITTVEDTTDPVSTTDQSGTADITNAVGESTLKPLYTGSSLICPNMPAGLSPSDYTDVKFLLDFTPHINFTEMMSKSLDQRQHLETVTQSMVYKSFSAEVAATVANIWPKEFGISFTVHKAFHRNDINMTAMAEEFHANWANGSVGLDIFGLGVKMKPPGLSYERGFWSVCEEDCSKLDSQACYQHTSCQWCVFEGAPHCGADCLLQEPEYEMSVFCPCLLEHKGLEQQLQDSFRDQVQQLLGGRFGGWNSTKPMYSINTTSSTITFSLKSSMQQRITPDVIDFLRNDSNWNGVTINDGFNQYQIMEPTGYTDVDVIVEFDDVDFTNLVGQYSISVDGLRTALNTTLTSIGVSPDCVASTRILRRGKNVLEFSMSRALDSTVNLTAEVNKLVEANRNGEFNLNLRPGWPVSKSVSKTETFDSICPSVDLWATTDTVYPPGMCPCPTEGSISLVYEDQAASAGLSTPDKLGLAVGLPIAVAALSALGVLLMFYFKKKGSNRPPTAFRRTAVSPAVQSFETNIYSASIDDNLSHQFGKKGSQLNRFRDPDAVYGRLSYSPPPSTASSTLTSEMSLPGSPDYFY
ncbi:uncharacterized protein [Branchiostoma lanceolatum]|uniref:uncharacterized protein n=1 Tax=Branchiostoma lanceolatum TaxID=7740 RepID=UPI003451D861